MTSSSSSLCSTCSIFSLTSYGSRITFRKMGCCTFTNLKGGFQSLDVSIIFFHQGFILNEDTHTVRHCDTVDQTGFNFSSQFRLSNIDFSPWAKGAPQSYLNFSQKGNGSPEQIFKWNFVGCNLRCSKDYLYSTPETMNTADPVSTSMLTVLLENNWT